MKLKLAILLMFFAATANAQQNPFENAKPAEPAKEKPTVTYVVPYDYQCYQPEIVQWVSGTLVWQQARIAELERQLAERK